jgi:hypothetical protein
MEKIAHFLQIPDSLRLKEYEIEKVNSLQTGFIAQEVEQLANKLGYDFSGIDKPKNSNDYYGLRYAEFTVPLVKAVQELNENDEKQHKLIEALQQEIESLKSELDAIKSMIAK